MHSTFKRHFLAQFLPEDSPNSNYSEFSLCTKHFACSVYWHYLLISIAIL